MKRSHDGDDPRKAQVVIFAKGKGLRKWSIFGMLHMYSPFPSIFGPVLLWISNGTLWLFDIAMENAHL